VPVAQTGARMATKGGAQASNARPNGPTSRNVGRGAVDTSARAAYLRPTGSLSVETRAALANYQRDQGLIITGAIDQPTIESLGLY
jgi:hypothetical protein